MARSGGGSEGPEGTASGGNNQVKKLKKRVKKLEQQVEGLAKQQGPPGQDATKLFAYIRDDTSAVTANVQFGSGVTAVSDPAGNGQYEVTFNRSLVNCVVQAEPGFGNPRAGGNAFPASAFRSLRESAGRPGKRLIQARGQHPSVVDTSFLITAFC